ncbi:MAG: TIGR03087 family PEP-CTERM/XrtA system glycosyltransferase [Elainellaceae cyanobacterium]
MNILMLSATFPYPPTRGGTQVRTFNLLKHLSQHHAVTLMTLRSPEVTEAEVAELRQWVHELQVFSKPDAIGQPKGTRAKLARFSQFLLDGTPPNVLSIYSPQAQAWLDQAIATGQYNAITCEHSVNEMYVRPQWRSQLRTIVNIHSSVYGTCKNQLETATSEHYWRDRLNLPLLHRYEKQYCGKFSGIVVTTAEDQQQIQSFQSNAEITVIANGVDFEQFPYRSPDPAGHRLIFIGAMDNIANIDAVRFFGQEVFPLLRQRYPNVTLDLVGARPVPEVQALGQISGITVTGRVPSMVEYLHRATICVVPMRTGFGIKNKTLEAMAAGVPVVGSDRGLEGLSVDGDAPLRALRANQVNEYIQAIDRLFEEPQLRLQLSQAARQMVEQHYTWQQAGAQYERMVIGKQR